MDLFEENQACNEREIGLGQVVLDSRPRALFIDLTNRCCLACPFCHRSPQPAAWDLPERTCAEIEGLYPYLQLLVWQGGEAQLHPRFRELVAASLAYPRIRQTLVTSGALLDEDWLDLFLRSPDFTLVLPLESVDPVRYAALRRGADLSRLEASLEKLRELEARRGKRLTLILNTIVMRGNFREVEAIVDFALDRGFRHIILTPLYPGPGDFYARESVSPEDPEVRDVLAEAMPRIRCKIETRGASLSDRFLGSTRRGPPPREAGPFPKGAVCLAPWQQLFVAVQGRLQSYCYCPEPIGSLDTMTLADAWNAPAVVRMRQRLLKRDRQACCPKCWDGWLGTEDLKLRRVERCA